ncbi:MAG: hypothetical protein E7409_00520 [Ruminococcaceae bacterium]|nr:hypothetical protein [Oscillospiraceae bacterium]
MKKIISLIVVAAMMLSMMVMPSFAADMSLLATGEALTASMAVNDNEIAEGDTFTVDVKLAAIADYGIHALDMSVSYDAEKLEYVTAELATNFAGEGNYAGTEGAPANTVALVYSVAEGGYEFPTEGGEVTVGTITFKAKETGADAEVTFAFADADVEVYEVNAETYVPEPYTITNAAGVTVAIKAKSSQTVSALIGGNAIVNNGVYYGAQDITFVTSDDAPIATIAGTYQAEGEEAVAFDTAEFTITPEGTKKYTLTITSATTNLTGVSLTPAEAVTFTIDNTTSNLTLAVVPEADENIAEGTSTTYTVSVNGFAEGSLGASMVSFDVTYDPTLVTVSTTSANVEATPTVVDANTTTLSVKWENTTAPTKGGQLVVLTVSALSGKAGEEGTLVFNNQKASKYLVNPLADADFTIDTAEITRNFAILSSEKVSYELSAAGWQNGDSISFPIGLELVDEATAVVKYAASDVALDESYDWENAAEITDFDAPAITVTESKDYYVYVLDNGVTGVYKVPATAIMYDNTAPVISVPEAESAWTNAASVDVSEVAATDAGGSGISGAIKYAIGVTADGASAEKGNAVEIPAATIAEAITFYVEDAAGNSATATMTIKRDLVVPTVETALDPAGATSGSVTVIITPADQDPGSGVKTVSYKQEDAAEFTEIVADEGVYSFVVDENDNFVVKVTDGATNAVEANVAVTNIASINAADLQAKLYADAAAFTTVEAEKLAGTYKGIAIQPAVVEGYNSTLTVLKDGDSYDYVAGAAITEAGTYTVTVTTVKADNELVTATSGAYTFTIADALPSLNNDGKYNVVDLTMMKIATAKGLDRADYYGAAGYYADDLDGDFSNGDAEDLAEALKVTVGRTAPADYDFNLAKAFE